MSSERLLDDLARTLAEQMPRRRAVRVVGASLVALAVPGVSPRIARAGLATPRRCGGFDQATCPDGTTCDPGELCCDESNAHGKYNCRKSTQVCCCGNAICNPPKQRCWCPSLKAGGVCAHNCPLVYGRGWKDCGPTCCQPHERCADEAKGICKSCEDEGKQTCRSYDSKSSVRCCPATRTPGATSSCCASMTTTACCGPKQQCKTEGARSAQCICKTGEGKKCGTDCCKKDKYCCTPAVGATKHCCAKGTKCCGPECCGKDESCCQGLGANAQCCKKGQECCNGKCCAPGSVCCGIECCNPKKNEYCLVKKSGTDSDTCQKGCTASNKCGAYCCGTGTTCDRRRLLCV